MVTLKFNLFVGLLSFYMYAIHIGMEFEWHESKSKANVRKHGVAFSEAVTCFYDPLQIAFYDSDSSEFEDREIMIAHSDKARLLLVVYAIRGENIRIISARQATKMEAIEYERRI